MVDALLLTAAVLAATAGMGWLALAMDVHWAQVRDDPHSPKAARRLRWLGSAGLILSLWLCLKVDHATMASLVWVMALAGAALLVGLSLTWRPQVLKPLSAVCGRTA